jgi:hypothetical protein
MVASYTIILAHCTPIVGLNCFKNMDVVHPSKIYAQVCGASVVTN